MRGPEKLKVGDKVICNCGCNYEYLILGQIEENSDGLKCKNITRDYEEIMPLRCLVKQKSNRMKTESKDPPDWKS